MHALNGHRLSLKTKIGHQAGNGGHGFERFGMVTPIQKIEGVYHVARTVILCRSLPDADQPVWFGIGQGAEKHGVNDAEYRGVGADAESQREDGDGGKARTAMKHAEGVAKIARGFVQPADDVHSPCVFFE